MALTLLWIDLQQYSAGGSEWGSLQWRNLYDAAGPNYEITWRRWDSTTGPQPSTLAEVKTYRGLLNDYLRHPEAKYQHASHETGWLQRRFLSASTRTIIGKETNRLEDTQAGLASDGRQLVSGFDSRNTALTEALSQLSPMSGRALRELTGLDRRTIDRVRQRRRASPRVEEAILRAAGTLIR